jgi:hypothetical protein
MPVVGPGGTATYFISDLVPEVLLKTGARTGASDSERAAQWLVDAILEISGNPQFRDEFDELEEWGPTYNLTIGLQEYDFSHIVPAGDINLATLDLLIWRDPPTNQLRQRLRSTSYQETDKSQIIPGPPVAWYRFSDLFGLNPVPDQTYQVQARVLRQHPITYPGPSATQILLPRDWNEILVLAAAERGFIELEEYEKARAINVMLKGDPRYPDKPGMMFGRKKRRARENWRDTKALRPIVSRYGSR